MGKNTGIQKLDQGYGICPDLYYSSRTGPGSGFPEEEYGNVELESHYQPDDQTSSLHDVTGMDGIRLYK
jgi:hypothetical protein